MDKKYELYDIAPEGNTKIAEGSLEDIQAKLDELADSAEEKKNEEGEKE